MRLTRRAVIRVELIDRSLQLRLMAIGPRRFVKPVSNVSTIDTLPWKLSFLERKREGGIRRRTDIFFMTDVVLEFNCYWYVFRDVVIRL